MRISILDIQGKEVFKENFGMRPAGEYSETIKANIAAGTYTLHILLDEKIVARKIIKVE